MLLGNCLKYVSSVLLSLLFISYSAADEQQPQMPTAEMLLANAGNVGKDWVTEKTGETIPLDAIFVDENGREVTLGSIIDRPTLILPIYFFCPNSCSTNLANMAVSMNRLSFEPGRDYKAIALSFSHTENVDNARNAKKNYAKLLYDQFPRDQWKFLTGEKESIRAVTDALGYRFKRLPDQTFLHPSAIIVVDKEGKIIRYIYGTFIPGDLDLAISSASKGTPMLSVKRMLDFCFNYDPSKTKSVFQLVKIAVIGFFALSIGLLLFWAGRKRKAGKTCDKDNSNTEQDVTR